MPAQEQRVGRGRNRDDSMNERRRANRVDFDGEATLIFQQDSYPVSLDDISIMGARLNSSTRLGGSCVRLNGRDVDHPVYCPKNP